MQNYEYVFSTGNYLDSLAVYGRLVDAFDLKPPEDPVTILLYNDLADSAFLTHGPLYVSRTDKDGYFALSNLRADTFRLYALKDLNANFKFDLPNEEIAFLDTSLLLTAETFPKIAPDTLTADTTGMASDSLLLARTDSIKNLPGHKYEGMTLINLFLFEEYNEKQYLTDFSRRERSLLEFSFSNPLTDSFRIESIRPSYDDWYLKEKNILNDTIHLWITDPEVIREDTVTLSFIYTGTDSAGMKVRMADTVNFTYREPLKSRKKNEAEVDSTLSINTIKDRVTLELNQPILITAEVPVDGIDTSFIHLYMKEDSVFFPENYNLVRDSLNFRNARIYKNWEEKRNYRLTMYPGAFKGIYGNVNDTIDVGFSTREEGYYGVLHVNMSNVDCPLIVQLMDTKEKVLIEKNITSDGMINFDYLKPSQYKIKVIHDCNGNGKWDTGKYITGTQPEKVEYYKGEINVRSNWELEISFTAGSD